MGRQQMSARFVSTAVTVVLAAILLLPAPPALAAARNDQTILGDLNGDGQITAADALAILSAAIGKSLPEGWEAGVFGDTSCDARVTAKDALIVLVRAIGGDVSALCIGEVAKQTCTNCHASDVEMVAKQQEFALSKHGPGQYVRENGECAVCHTHLGFLERLKTGMWSYSAGTVPDLMPTDCRTCHPIHTTYSSADYAVMAEGIPVQFRVANQTVDFGNKSNLCAACHQSRIRSGQMAVIDGDPVTFTSTHYGPHYGSEGDISAGVGFYDFAGGNGGMMSHQTDSRGRGCPTCHMAEGGPTSGGHTFEMGSNTTGCEACHSTGGGFDKFGQQTQTKALLDELGALLEAAGLAYHDVAADTWHPIPGTYPANAVAALWNFLGVIADGSLGVHNPPYVKALLEGAIAAMK